VPNTRDIRRRIRSVRNTSQITRAMQLVAAAKMKKAQDQAVAGRPYSDRLNQVLAHLKERNDEEDHPLLGRPRQGPELVLVVSTDKGLCGGLNTNLLRKFRAEVPQDAHLTTVGRKLRLSLAKLGRNIVSDWEVRDPVPFADAKPIAKYLTEQFIEGRYSLIRILFSNFQSTLTQVPWISQLLPIEPAALAVPRNYEKDRRPAPAAEPPAPAADHLFEPGPREVLDALLPLYVNFQVYQMLLEARASEHSARMVAMKNATDNAESMIKDLTLEYNKLRQAAITSELLEITTAMKAME